MSRTDDASVLERLARAAHSDDLSHRPTLCDVDFLHGLGMVGQRMQQGTALLDLDMTLEPDAAREAMRVALEITREAARRRGWPMTALKARKISSEALALYLRPACPPCKGRGMLNMDMDKPGCYRPKPCPTCGGSGKKPVPLKHRREITEVLYVMEARRTAAMNGVRKVMRVRGSTE